MKKRILLSMLLSAITILGTIQSASATSQVIYGTLSASKTITVGSGTVTASIDPGSGALDVTMTPSFDVSTNEDTGGITYEARVTAEGGVIVSGLYTTTTPTVDCYIALCNTIGTRLPTQTAITNAFTGGGASPNVISYKMTKPAISITSGSGTMAAFTWTGATTGTWNSTGTTGGGVFNVATNVGTAAQKSSYESSLDLAGEYQATLRMTFDS